MFKRIKHSLSVVANKLPITQDSFMMTLVGIVVILGPILFIPVSGLSPITSKGFLFVIIGLVAVLTYGVGVLRSGSITVPRSPIFTILGLITLTGFIGALLSSSFKMSFWGYGFETTTWLFMALFGVFCLASYKVISTYEKVGILYGGMIGSFALLVLFHVIRYIGGGSFADLGVLGSGTSSLIGSWSDLAIFFGFIALFCVATLELAGLKRSFKWVVGSIGVIAMIMLLFINISIVWIILGLIALVFSLYLFSFAYWDVDAKNYRKENRIPWFSLGLFIISIGAIFFGTFFNNLASRHQSITWNDVRPSVKMTAKVAGTSLGHNFATGYGPNGFTQAWSMAKPAELSGSNTLAGDFGQGFGFVPSQIAANGIVGAILWVALFAFIIIALAKKTIRGFSNAIDRYFSIILGTSILYLGIMAWVYLPGAYLLILLSVLIGAFLAVTAIEGAKSVKTYSFIKDPRASFFGILAVTVLIVATLFAGYVTLRKLTSFVHFVKGTALINQNNLSGGANELSIAAAYASYDIYHQQLTSLALGDIAKLSGNSNTDKAALSAQAEKTLGVALGHAQAATTANPGNYKNWILLGNVYRTMLSLGVTEAYDRAGLAYAEAQKRAPHDVTIPLYNAQLEIAHSDIPKALGIITDSINKFPTADAYVLKAQIEISQQKFDDALTSVKAAVNLAPYNANLAYQYGLLAFSQKQYALASLAFQRAIVLNRSYAIAYVYLGVSLERQGNIKDAETVYDYIKKQFPDGADAIDKLKAGTVETPAPTVDDTTATPSANTTTQKQPVKTTKTPVAPTTKKQ